MSSAALARQFWRDQNDVTTLAVRDLRRWWASVDKEDPRGVIAAMDSFLPDLVQMYGEIGASLASDFYDEVRDGSGEVAKAYRSTLTDDVVRLDQVKKSSQWAISPLWGVPDEASALTLLSGVTKRLVLAPARNTIRENVYTDPEAAGWKRVGDGDSCKFCRMLIGRGEVYSPDTAKFAAHDDCGCAAAPEFAKDFEPVRAEQWIASKERNTRADKVRLKAFLSNMDDKPAPALAVVPD